MTWTQKIIGASIVSLLVGAGLGWFFGQRTGFTNGRKNASEELIAKGVLQPLPHGLTSIAGTVVSVDAGQQLLHVHVPQVIMNPLSTQAPTERIVRVTADTTLIRQRPRSQAEYEKELAAIRKQWERSPAAVAPPEPKRVLETPIYFRDIVPGAVVTIESNADILYTAAFDVVRVVLSE